jgi:hypothetical protein
MYRYSYSLDEQGVLRVYLADGRLLATLGDVTEDRAEALAIELVDNATTAPFEIVEYEDEANEDLIGYLFAQLSSNAMYDGMEVANVTIVIGKEENKITFTVNERKFELREIGV